jgi:hypothetical protein
VSHDIYFKRPGTDETIQFDEAHDLAGGTYAMGGTTEAWLNITYNYGAFFRDHIDAEEGIRALYGKTGAECVPILEKAVAELGTERARNYWAATPGNAGAALNDLLTLAKLCPDGICAGD